MARPSLTCAAQGAAVSSSSLLWHKLSAYVQRVPQSCAAFDVAALTASLDLAQVTLRMPVRFSEVVLAHTAFYGRKCERLLLQRNASTRRPLGKYIPPRLLSGAMERRSVFGVAGISSAAGRRVESYSLGQNPECRRLVAFGHYGHVGFSLVVKSAPRGPIS